MGRTILISHFNRTIITLLLLLLFVSCGSNKLENQKAEELCVQAEKILNSSGFDEIGEPEAQQVLDYMSQAVKLENHPIKCYYLRGLAYFNLNKYDLALKDFNFVLDKHQFYFVYNSRGKVYNRIGQYVKSENDYFKSIELNSKDAQAYFYLGQLYIDQKNYPKSIKAYNSAILLNDASSMAYANRGFCKMMLGEYNESITDNSLAIKLDPANKIAYNTRGMTKFYLKDYQNALLDFESNLNIDDVQGINKRHERYSYNNIGNCHQALGNITEACKYWHAAIDNGYQYIPEWKAEFKIDNPVDLINKYCN